MPCTSTTKTVQYVYDKFKKYGFEMDLTAIVEHDLNYVKLLARYLRWRRDGSDLGEKEGPLDSRMGIQELVEYMRQKQVGYLTPRSFLYAVDCFTIQPLVSSTEESSVPLRIHELGPTRAPCFLIATLVALETAVGDPYRTKPVRVACGKL